MPDQHNSTPALQQVLCRLLKESFAPEGEFANVGSTRLRLAVESEDPHCRPWPDDAGQSLREEGLFTMTGYRVLSPDGRGYGVNQTARSARL
jgi:hypothetical protein